jgi:hypothetical protein
MISPAAGVRIWLAGKRSFTGDDQEAQRIKLR